MKALALFSGGLDSALAIKVVQEQGIEVIALNFVSYFFGGKNVRAENMAKQLGVRLEYVDFSSNHMEILKNPIYGRGKNMNPCIDCHALMFKKAGELLKEFQANFIISGEVLGQRPMSQNYQALEKVKKLSSGLEELIVRPLSAKLLPESLPEKEGWINREKMLSIQGRSRKEQMELVEKYGLIEYETPGGGCLLTDPAYSRRLKILEEDGLLEDENAILFELLKVGRFYRLSAKKYLIVGRDKESNLIIEKNRDIGKIYIRGKKIAGPHIIGYGELTDEELKFAQELFSNYSKIKGEKKIIALCNDMEIEIETIDKVKLKENILKYQIV